MIVPKVAAGARDDLAALRKAADQVVASLVAVSPDRIVVLGAGSTRPDLDESAGGTFGSYGVDLHVGGAGDELPLSLAVGAWLLDRAGWTGPRTYSTGVPDIAERVSLLVMADGSAKRTPASPGFHDDRAQEFDVRIAAALAAGDSEDLASLDVDLGAELWATAAAPLRTLGHLTKGADVVANLRVDVAPFGVGYWVADWVVN